MNNYLSRLAARSLGLEKTIKPRMPSIFEPAGMGDGQLSGFDEEILSLESLDKPAHKMGPEASYDFVPSTNHLKREEAPYVDQTGNTMQQPKNPSPASYSESNSLHPSLGEDQWIEMKDLPPSSARSMIQEKVAEKLHLREIRSIATLPDRASHEAVYSVAMPEKEAIRSQEESPSSAKANPSPARLRIADNAGEKLHLGEIRSVTALLDRASHEAASSTSTPEKEAIRSQDESPGAVKANESPSRSRIQENVVEKLHLRVIRSDGTLPDRDSHEAVYSAATPQKEAVRSQEESSGSTRANPSPGRLQISENVAEKLHLRENPSARTLLDRALLIPASLEALLGDEIGIQGQGTGYGSHLKDHKQNARYPSISASLKREDNSIRFLHPAAIRPYKNDLLPHFKSTRMPTSRAVLKSTSFAKKPMRQGIDREMPTPKTARKDYDNASMPRNALQHVVSSVRYEDRLTASDSVAERSEPRPPLRPSARAPLQSGVRRLRQRASMASPKKIKAEVEGDIVSRSMVHKTEIDLQGDLNRSGILNPDLRMVQSMMPLGPPAKRHESPTGREFADLNSDNSPEVHVTIGRIEVRAVTSPEPQRRRESPETVGLDEYLRKRSGGKR